MADQSRNEGFHVLDDFVCEAIHSAAGTRANSATEGRNTGMLMVEELDFDASTHANSHERTSSSRTVASDDVLIPAAQRLAVLLSRSEDPTGAAAAFQKLLLDELARIQRNPDAE